jgi:histidine ammonia-lyase
VTVTLETPADLTAAAYAAVVDGGEDAAIAEAALARVAGSRALFLRHLDTGVVCYGVNTGLGALAGTDLSPEDMAALPRHILLGRAAGIGPPMRRGTGRGALLIKLMQFLTGTSAVTPGLCQAIAGMLNAGLDPAIPSQGHGMAGEIVPLSHAAQTLIGEGMVFDVAGLVPAAAWLDARGLDPYVPQSKEGLSLINGVAVAPARTLGLLPALRRLLSTATLSAAASVEGLAAPLEAFAPEVALLRPDPGIATICATLGRLLQGSTVTRHDRQPPVSFRVVPQVHGAFAAALDRLEAATLGEVRANGDNPAFLADPDHPAMGRLLHCGNFHSAELTLAIETATLVTQQMLLLSERRLHRLLDARQSGLAPQLALRPGLDAGLVILHKAALGLTARLRALAVAPSLLSGDSSFGQEDAMTMALPALDRLDEVVAIGWPLFAYELYAALVAIDCRGETPGAGVAATLKVVRQTIPPYAGDRIYGPEIEILAALIRDQLALPGMEQEA